MTMLRIVIDTNVFVSAIIAPGSAPARIVQYWQSRAFRLVSCPRALDELNAVLQRPRLLGKYPVAASRRENLLSIIREGLALVPGDSIRDAVADDPKDNMFIACAVEAQAKYIVSGDKHLLRLRRYQSTRILEPARFLAILIRCHRRFMREQGMPS